MITRALTFFVILPAFGCLVHAADPVATFVPANAPAVAAIRALGESATDALSRALRREAEAASLATTLEAALAACHRTPPKSSPLIPDLPQVTAYKRTALRVRDPANAPDAAEQLAFERLRTLLNEGERIPKVLVQQLAYPDGRREWRVYRPLTVTPSCLRCHGSSSDIPMEIRRNFAQRYPKDDALNYTTDSWRGLLRVTLADMPAP